MGKKAILFNQSFVMFIIIIIIIIIVIFWSAGVSWSLDDARRLIHSPFDCTWSGAGLKSLRITLQQHKNVAVSHMSSCLASTRHLQLLWGAVISGCGFTCNNTCTAEIISTVHMLLILRSSLGHQTWVQHEEVSVL